MTEITYTDRDAATITTHDLQVARYTEEWRDPETQHRGPTPLREVQPESVPPLQIVLQRLAEAKSALRISTEILTEVEESLSVRRFI